MFLSKSTEDFPRSDGPKKTTERATGGQIKRQSDQLFKKKSSKPAVSTPRDNEKKRRRKKAEKAKNEAENDNGESVKEQTKANSSKIVIESLDIAKLPTGMLVYGCIEEVGDFELKFCITSGIGIKVPITNISNSYTKLIERFTNDEDDNEEVSELAKLETMFQIGDYYPIKVIAKNATQQYGHIEIIGSLNPSDIYEGFSAKTLNNLPQNYPLIGTVSTIEDYGYGIDLGVEDAKAFLSFEEHKKTNKNQKLNIGQLIHCSIIQANERSFQLTTNKKKIGTTLQFDDSDSKISITNFVPGTKTQITVTGIHKQGLEISLPGEYKGFVPKVHISDDFSESSIDSVELNQTYEGTVLYVQPFIKQVCISLKDCLTKKSIKTFQGGFKFGMIVKNAVVCGKGMSGSLIFKLNGNQYAFCRRKNLAEASELEGIDLDKRFPLNSQHLCKVKNFNLFDNLVEISLKKSFIEKETLEICDLKVGQILECSVKRHDPKGMFVKLGPGIDGFVPTKHLTDSVFKNMNMEKMFPLKSMVKCRILKLDTTSKSPRISLTMKKTLLKVDQSEIFTNFEDIEPGKSSLGVICLIQPQGILAEFFNSVAAFIPLKNLAAYKIEYPEKVFSIGQIVKVTVMNVYPEKRRMVGTLVDIVSLKKNAADKKASDPDSEKKRHERRDNSTLEVGQLLRKLKVCHKVNTDGLDLANGSGSLKVFLPMGHLSDDSNLSQETFTSLKPGDVIDKVMVFRKDLTNFVTVTMKKSFLDAVECDKNANTETKDAVEDKNEKKLRLVKCEDDIELNVPFPAVIRNVTENGVFFEIAGGFCGVLRKKYFQDSFYDHPEKLGLKKNQTVVVCAVESSINPQVETDDPRKAHQLKRFKFSMKLSDVLDKADVNKRKEEFKSKKEQAKLEKIEARRKEKRDKKARLRNERRLKKLGDLGKDGDSDKKDKKNATKERVTMEEFQWDIPEPTPSLARKRKLLNLDDVNLYSEDEEDNDPNNNTAVDNDSNNDDDNEDSVKNPKKKKLTKEEQRQERKNRESELRERENSLTDPKRKLKSVEDYEMAVVAQPNSSMIWLKFMSHYLETEDYGMARQIGQRALEKISFRESKEKLNIWIGLLNLENQYGDAESLDKVLQKAIQYNDAKTVYLQLASIYELSDKSPKADDVYQLCLKKFKQDKAVWIEYLVFLMKGGKVDLARKQFQKSLLSLEKRDHVDVISKFAQLEFRFGDCEQAKTIFEQMLGTYWKRLDQWSVYIDMLVKYTLGDDKSPNVDSMEYIRNVFERLISFKFSPERMKFVFKKYYDFEAKYQPEDSEILDRIKQKALEYVEKDIF